MCLQRLKNSPDWVQSPLNYTGGKFKLLSQIMPLFPGNIDVLVDLFCGGGNVGVNALAGRVVLNDFDSNIIHIFDLFRRYAAADVIASIEDIISDYGLSDSKINGYSFYHCESNRGLGAFNREKYNHLRTDMNNRVERDDRYYFMLFTLIIFAFNNQIRFNNKGEFNLPVGKRDFNNRMKTKVQRFSDKLKDRRFEFSSVDFRDVRLDGLTEQSLIYADPPYLVTCATYNESNGWNAELERHLLDYLDEANARGIKFALSNVLKSGDKENEILREWAERAPDYVIHHLDYHYGNSNYHKKDRSKASNEVLITNFG